MKGADSTICGKMMGEMSDSPPLRSRSKPASEAREDNLPIPPSDSLWGSMVVTTLYCLGRIRATKTPSTAPIPRPMNRVFLACQSL
ncbi:MAG: hypothetical protein BWY72_02286 [Bacteroidetes bacterium ADurb.Bin416]|nr:MAG: hypothetical protein BWY72_02286 [Bacteroidetes bacterium ADurb.Bin416]